MRGVNERSVLEWRYLSKSLKTIDRHVAGTWPKEKEQPWTCCTAHATLERKDLCLRAVLVNMPSMDRGELRAGLTCSCRFCYLSSHSWRYWLLYPLEGRICCKHDVKPKQVISLTIFFVHHMFKLVLQTPFCPQLLLYKVSVSMALQLSVVDSEDFSINVTFYFSATNIVKNVSVPLSQIFMYLPFKEVTFSPNLPLSVFVSFVVYLFSTCNISL